MSGSRQPTRVPTPTDDTNTSCTSKRVEKEPYIKKEPNIKKEPHVKREPGLEQEPVDKKPKKIKVEACDTRPSLGDPFAWRIAHNLDLHERVVRKEQAVQNAEACVIELEKIISSSNFSAGGAIVDALQAWVKDAETVRHEFREFEVCVGATGATGAGKTSLLNALLDRSELLPAGHERAATAVACRVKWNYDEEKGHENRAEIHFRTEDDVLDDVLQTLQAKQRLEETLEEDFDVSGPQHREEALAEVQAELDDGMDRLSAVWPQFETQIDSLVTSSSDDGELEELARTIVESNPIVLQLLRQKSKTEYRTGGEAFAKLIKPFLDSTSSTHGGDAAFAAWPLLQSVDLFISTPLLRSGITLIDLPGTGDNVESRSRIQSEYRNRLDVVLIVAQIARAVNQKDLHELLNKQHKAQATINGCSLGIILTKMEDLDYMSCIRNAQLTSADDYILQHWDLHQELKKKVSSAARQKGQLERRLRKLKPKRQSLEETLLGQCVPAKQERTRLKLEKVTQEITSKERQTTEICENENKFRKVLSIHEAHICHWAICARNENVAGQLRAAFARLKGSKYHDKCVSSIENSVDSQFSSPSSDLNDGCVPESAIEVMASSAKVFTKLRHDNQSALGLPTEEYTGIPFIRQWISRETSAQRESHLDIFLEHYAALYESLYGWCASQNTNHKISVQPEDVKLGLEKVHEKYYERLRTRFDMLSITIESLNTFTANAPAAEAQAFCKEAERVLGQWAMKFPDDPLSNIALHHSTHKAVVSSYGGPYTSKSNPKVTHDWVPRLAKPLIDSITHSWRKLVTTDVQGLIEIATATVMNSWKDYVKELGETTHQFDRVLGHFFQRDVMAHLEAPVKALTNVVARQLTYFDKGDSGIYGLIVNGFKTILRPMFVAVNSMTGAGSFKLRKEFIHDFVGQKSELLFKKIRFVLVTGFTSRREAVIREFQEGAQTMINSIRGQTNLALDNVFGNGDVDERLSLRGRSEKALSLWRRKWQFPDDSGEEKHVLLRDLSIPKVLSEADLERPVSEDNAEENEDSESSGTDEDCSDGEQQ